MAVSTSSKGVSFSELRSRAEVTFWDEDDNRRPRRNPFDDLGSDFEFVDSDSLWVSSKEVSDFMKTSRGLSLSDDDEEELLGAAWGGLEYSLASEKSKSDTGHTSLQSVRTRSQAATSAINQRTSYSADTKAQTQPARESSTSMRSTTSSTRTIVSSSIPSSSSVSCVSAAAVRNQTQITPRNSVPTAHTALQNVSTSIQDVLADSPQVSVTEYNRLQTEIGRLRHELQAARREKTSLPPVEETVKKIMQRQPYSLEGHKSLKDKMSLLQHAIKVHDGNVITEVVLFLKKTLTQRIFLDEIKRHPKAVHHLCKYLRDHYKYDELTEFYRFSGRFEDAAMLQFEQAIKTKDPNGRLTKLKYILRQYFEGYQQLTEETAFLKEYIDLLDQQLIIESTDSKAQMERKNHVMVVHPRQASLPLCSVIVTLYYCCRYHFGEPENIFSSPLATRAKFKLSEKQYEWTALSARANLKRWPDIEQILTAKGWFGSTKMKSAIGFKQVVDILHQHRAPDKVLWTYLKLMDDRQERLSLATKLQCHEAVIETLVAMKDRQQLEEYRKKLKRTAPEQAKITDYLNNSQIKWKN